MQLKLMRMEAVHTLNKVNNKGMTLVELLVSVVLLTGVMVFMYRLISDVKSQKKKIDTKYSNYMKIQEIEYTVTDYINKINALSKNDGNASVVLAEGFGGSKIENRRIEDAFAYGIHDLKPEQSPLIIKNDCELGCNGIIIKTYNSGIIQVRHAHISDHGIYESIGYNRIPFSVSTMNTWKFENTKKIMGCSSAIRENNNAIQIIRKYYIINKDSQIAGVIEIPFRISNINAIVYGGTCEEQYASGSYRLKKDCDKNGIYDIISENNCDSSNFKTALEKARSSYSY